LSFQQTNKYNPHEAELLLLWMKELLGGKFNTSGERENFHTVLKDGQILCK